MTNPFRQDRPANTTLPQTVAFDTPFDQGAANPSVTSVPPPTTRRRKQVKFDDTYEDIDANPSAEQRRASLLAQTHQESSAEPVIQHGATKDKVQEPDLDSEDDEEEPEVAGAGTYRPITQNETSVGALPNPFARTLAAIEPTSSQNADYETRSHPRIEAANETSPNRASMDVNAFTQMLLGKTEKPVSSDLAPRKADGLAERKLSQESDVARSPRSSLDQVRPTGVNTDSSPLGPLPDKPSKPKPPPPRHRHGKPVSESGTPDVVSPGPQVVSFDDFAASFSSTAATTPAQPTSHRNSLNLSQRPLPAPPPPPSHHHGHAISTIPSSPSVESLQPTEGAKPAKKQAPPPPMARRSSNLRHEVSSTSTSRPRSGTASSIMSEENIEDSGLTSPRAAATPEPSAKVPPPPPPARRSGAHRDSTSMPTLQRQGSAASSINQRPGSSASMTAPRDRSTSQVSQSPSHGMVPPPPPPRRTSSRSSISNSARTSLDLSAATTTRNSIEAPRRTSAEIRRSSAEMRRSSNSSQKGATPYASRSGGGEIIDEEATQDVDDGESRLARTESNNRSSKDVLADMDAFQREIDELRSRYSQQSPPVIDTRVDQA